MAGFFSIAFLVQAAYAAVLAAGWRRARRAAVRPSDEPPDEPSPISLVVAARNEARRLPALLAAVGRQTHPRFEVVVADDGSTDDTAALVRRTVDARIRLVEADGASGKKAALARGIAAARHDLLAFTDADGVPPPGWLAELARRHAARPGTVFVGYGPLARAPGLVNRLARYETLRTALFTAAAIGWRRPYMAVGRNLSYARSVFERVGGFAHSARSLSGDDDLFVQEVHRLAAAEVAYVFAPETFVPSPAPPTWRGWLRQKRRHASAGRFYRRDVQVHLAAYHLSNLALWTAPWVLGWAGVGFWLGGLVLHGGLLAPAARRLGERDVLPWLPVLELGYVLYNSLLAPLAALRVPKRW